MNFVIDFIKGCVIGIANIVPGVSGGTLALMLGVYNKMLGAISGILKQFKKSVKVLLPILLGCAFGIIAFSFIITYLIGNHPFPTSMSFIGLIFGGLPMLFFCFKKAERETAEKKKSSRGARMVLSVLLFLFFLVGSILLSISKTADEGTTHDITFLTMFIFFLMGMVASAAMIIPGISGSLIMMILGYYFEIVGAVKDFVHALKDFDVDRMVSLFKILVPFGIGVVLGIFLVAKIIKWLLEKHPAPTYASILGLIVASPVSIFLKVEFFEGSLGVVPIIIGCVLFVVFFVVSLKFSKAEE